LARGGEQATVAETLGDGPDSAGRRKGWGVNAAARIRRVFCLGADENQGWTLPPA